MHIKLVIRGGEGAKPHVDLKMQTGPEGQRSGAASGPHI